MCCGRDQMMQINKLGGIRPNVGALIHYALVRLVMRDEGVMN